MANSGGLGGLNINASSGALGGDVGLVRRLAHSPGERHGPGGGGGGGFIAISGAAGTNAAGGVNGINYNRAGRCMLAAGATPSAQTGSVIAVTANQIPGASSGAQCVPTLTTTKTTSTPAVIKFRTRNHRAPHAIVSVEKDAANRGTAINLAISDTLPANFTYSSTVSVTLAGGATRPSTTNPAVGAAVPSWTSFSIPGGGSVTLTFIAQIASSVGAGTYQNPATATYSDPTLHPCAGGTTPPGAITLPQVRQKDVNGNAVRDLIIAKSHAGNFSQGQTGATYTLTATNAGSGATTGLVTVIDTLPASLTATNMSGTGWVCVLATRTCTRADALPAGTSYPVITVTVDVASNAPASVTNTATVSGGGEINLTNDTANDPTTIDPLPDLTIVKSHIGNFAQGQVGATYSITATNSGSAPTSGTVTVTDTLPASLTATDMSGLAGTCVLGTLTCTRSDVLAAGLSYSPITVTVTVANNAAASVTNSVSISGGGQIIHHQRHGHRPHHHPANRFNRRQVSRRKLLTGTGRRPIFNRRD